MRFTPAVWAVSGLFAATLAATAAPSITGLTPNGAHQFQPAANLSFLASGTSAITNVSVQLTGGKIGHTAFLRTLTLTHGLTATGSSTSETITAPLAANTLYSAVIQVTDATGATANASVSFDTITPSYTFEAEDFDFNGGSFIPDPQTNGYKGLSSVEGVDYENSNGGAAYRPLGLSTEGASDIPRVQYIGTTNTDYDVGFTDGGDFGSYTRIYPAGTYNIYMRGSDGGGQASDSASVSVTAGNASISGSGPFTFSVPNIGGWQAYSWVPAKGSDGSLAQLTTDGGQATLRISTDGGSYNANFYMLIPADTSSASGSTVVITNIYPNGTVQFQPTNSLTFTATSPDPISQSDITVQLTGTNLAGQGSVSVLMPGSGLTVSGNANAWLVSAPLASNTVYKANIQVFDLSGNPAVTTLTFDTITPGYTFEAEDYNHDNGLFYDNPQTNAYAGAGATEGVDFSCINNVHSSAYRGGAEDGFQLNTENAGDIPRQTHLGFQDYDVGFTSGGNWGDYTRHYPAGVYNIYVRYARGDNSSTVADAGSVSLVTSDPTVGNQTVTKLGTYAAAPTGDWQKYGWAPVIVSGTTLAQFTGGGQQTLRVTIDGGGHNQNYFMLLPADLTVKTPPFVTGFAPDGSSLFQYTNQLTFTAKSSAGLTTNNITLNLDGKVVHGFTATGSPSSWFISYPVALNQFHTAIITLTDTAGTTSSTNSFGTFASTNYQWEAEDYDYNGGSFFDNPQVDSYNGQHGVSGVDFVESDANASGYNYRPAPGIPTGTGDVASDGKRDQFTGATDYNIGFFGGGSWANYTRHYPAGTYNVVGRFAEGQTPTEAQLSLVTSGYGNTNQTTSLLGTFYIPPIGWTSWEWASLLDASGNPAKVYLDGSQTTLRLSGTPVNGQPEVNVNFLMLIATTPSPTLTAAVAGSTITISFPTQTGYSYQVQSKNTLSDSAWTPVGGLHGGNGSTQSQNDSVTGSTTKFYRVQVQ
ncbi:MAG TPA: hypothetical protein VHB20_00220 [Verrucomicrobiae bacterium]|nr:hypothetical protein [Verrucomicrobiae bacterium]